MSVTEKAMDAVVNLCAEIRTTRKAVITAKVETKKLRNGIDALVEELEEKRDKSKLVFLNIKIERLLSRLNGL